MGICCCKRSQVAERSAGAATAEDNYLLDHATALNPFSDPPPALMALPHSQSNEDAHTVVSIALSHSSGEGGNGYAADGSARRGTGASSPSLIRISRRRRGAVCAEPLSRYLRDLKWWVKNNSSNKLIHKKRRSSGQLQLTDEQEKESEEDEATEELAIVRAVLCTHPFFAACADDEELLEEMLATFERQETQPGERIAEPGDVMAFHVVVKGKAVAVTSTDAVTAAAIQADGAPDPSTALAGDAGLTTEEAKATEVSTTRPNVEWQVRDAFGHEGLLYPMPADCIGASVRAATQEECEAPTTVTWRISRVRYQQLRRLHNDQQLRRILKILSQCPLFQHLTAEQLMRVCEKADIVARDADAPPLLQTGEVPTDLFVLISGTVAVEHERANDFGGRARLQAAVLGPGDCIGDDEWLSGDTAHPLSSRRGVAAAYTYTVQRPIEAVRISLNDLCALLSSDDLAAMREGSRNLREKDQRRDNVREAVRVLVEQSLLSPGAGEAMDNSEEDDIDSDGDEHDGVSGGVSTQRNKNTDNKNSNNKEKSPSTQQYTAQSAVVREPLSEDVTVKSAEVTNFLLEHFFSRPTYCLADGRERGLSMAAFTARRHYPHGSVLFDVDYEPRDDVSAHARRTSATSLAGRETLQDAEQADSGECRHRVKADRLYVVVSGEVQVIDADTGSSIFSVVRGGSVGEEGLLPPLRCSTATALHTTTRVTSADGCDVYELSARAFREFLRRPYTAGIRHFCSVFCVLPYAEYFPENYWRFLFHGVTEREVVGGDLVAVRGAPCVYVALLLDGQVRAYTDGAADGGADDGARGSRAVATFGRGDVVAGQEAVEGAPLAVAYVCECRTRMLCVPAASFNGLFRPAMSYLRTLWSQERYQAVLKA